MPNGFRNLIFDIYSKPSNVEGNPQLQEGLSIYGNPNIRTLLEPQNSPGLRITPNEQSFFDFKNLKGLFLGIGDLAKIPFSLAANFLNALTPGVEVGNIPTPLGPLSQELGVLPTPQSFSEVPGALAEATTIPQLFRRASQLANDPNDPSAAPTLETLARVAGELTIAPLLDVAFDLGIDPARKGLPYEERWRQFPGAVLAVIPAAKLGAGFKGLFGKSGLADLTSALENTKLFGSTDFGGISFEKFDFKPGMSVSSPKGIGIIDRINKSGVFVNVDGEIHRVPRKQLAVNFTPEQKIGKDFIDVIEAANKIDDDTGLRQLSSDDLNNFFQSEAMGKLMLNRMGRILSNEEINTLPVTEQLLLNMKRSFDPDAVAQYLRKQSGDTMDLATAKAHGTKMFNDYTDALRAVSTESGKSLEFFSRLEEYMSAADKMSKDPARRLLALEKDSRIHGLPDWWEKVVNQAQLSSMVSNFVTASRNFLGQGSRGLIQGLEDAAAEAWLHMKTKAKMQAGKEVNPLWLTKDGNIDISKMYADTLSNLYTIKDAIQDVPGRMMFFGKNMYEMADYSRKVFKALVNEENPNLIPKPDAYKGRFAWFDDIMDVLPTEAKKLYSSPTGETSVALFDAVTTANLGRALKTLVKGSPDELINNSRFNEFVLRTMPAMSEAFAGFFTTLNRFVEVEQRRLFTAARLRGNAARRGLTMEQWMNELRSAAQDKPGKVFDVPQHLAKDITDAVQYGLETTYGADPNGAIGSSVMRMYKAAPVLKQLGLPFPRFLFNRWAFITERNPGMFFNLLRKEARDALDGSVSREQVISALKAKAEAKGKKFKQPTEEFIDKRLDTIRQDAQIQASRTLAKGTMGAALLTMGWFIRNSARAGTRYAEVDLGFRDENDNPQYASLQNYGPEITIPLALGEAFKAIGEGKDLLKDVFTQSEFLDIAAGLRRIDETGLAILDFPELASSKGTPEAVTEVFSKILGSNVGRFFTFLNTFKDVAGVADLRGFGFEGSDELVMTDQTGDPFLGPSIRSLPRGFQRALIGEDPPDATSPFSSESLQTEKPLARALLGMNFTTKTKLERMVDSVNMKWSDAIGRQPTPAMSKLVAGELGKFFDTPLETGETIGDLITERTLQLEARMRAQGIKDPSVRRTIMRQIFTSARAAVLPGIRAQVIKSAIESNNPVLLQQVFGPTFGQSFNELGRRAFTGELNREF